MVDGTAHVSQYPVFLVYGGWLHGHKMAVVSLDTSPEFVEGRKGKDKVNLFS